MKILFIFTGGTIGSTASGGYIGTDSRKPALLLERVQELSGIHFRYEALEICRGLSENHSGRTIQQILSAVSKNTEKGYDGMIVTHGTDTLPYTAAALSYTCRPEIPILVVSANHPIEDPRSNGLRNLRAAVAWIEQKGRPGVWVPYCNGGEEVKVHCGTRLLACEAFSDSVRSAGQQEYGKFDSAMVFHQNPAFRILPDEIPPILCGDLEKAAERIRRIVPCPGMVYPSLEGIDYILHESYHSGTINTESFAPRDFFETARRNGTLIFVTGITSGISYESTRRFEELSVIPVLKLAPVAAYMKLWLLVSSGADPRPMMGRSLGGDVLPL